MPPSEAQHPPQAVSQQQRRGFWLRTLHQWHWISSSVCLVGMLLFAVTGITLNHAAKIEATPQVVNQQLQLPADLLARLGDREDGNAPIPRPATRFLDRELGISIGRRPAEWSPEEIYLSLEGFEALPGRGVRGTIEGMDFHLGNHRLVEELGLCSPELETTLERLERQGKTVVVLCNPQRAIALFAVADTVTDMTSVKHAFKAGVKAMPGLEW